MLKVWFQKAERISCFVYLAAFPSKEDDVHLGSKTINHVLVRLAALGYNVLHLISGDQ